MGRNKRNSQSKLHIWLSRFNKIHSEDYNHMIIDGTKKKEEELGGAGANPTLGQGSGQLTGGISGQTTTKGATGSGGFTNLNKYIDLNKGANNQTINNLGSAAGKFESEGMAANNQVNDASKQIQNKFAGYKGDQDFVKSAFNDPLKADQNRFGDLRKSLNINTQGDLSGFDDSTAQANATRSGNAAQMKAMTSKGGISDFLRSQRTGSRYTAGAQGLDNFLVSGTEEGQNQIADINKKSEALQNANQGFAAMRQGLTDQAQGLDQSLLSGTQIQERANRGLAENKGTLDAYQDGANSGARFAGDQSGGMTRKLFNDDQKARYSALAGLAGEDATGYINDNKTAYDADLAAADLRHNTKAAADRKAAADAAAAQAEKDRIDKANADAQAANWLAYLAAGGGK
jgi:hypothetical protein